MHQSFNLVFNHELKRASPHEAGLANRPPAAPRGGPPTNPEKPANQTMSAEGEKRERIGIVSPNESLDSCVPAFTLRASGAVAAALAEGRLDLDAGSGLVGVLDGLVDRAACTRLVKAAAAKCRFQRLQGGVRGDSVSWVPLFEDAGDADFDAAFRPVKDLLQGVGAAVCAYRKSTGGDDDEALLVPRVVQMGLYDGSGGTCAGYRAHKDNGGAVDVAGGRLADWRHKGDRDRLGAPRPQSNYRELTAVLYLNDPVGVEGGAGGELRCHCVDEVRRKRSTVDVEPEPGRLVLFRSRQLLHEVLPVRQWQRVAVTLWLLLPMPRIPPAKPPAPAPAGRRRVRVRVGKKPPELEAPAPQPVIELEAPAPPPPAPPPEVEVPAAPPPADLDAEIRETEEKLRRLRAAREAQQQQTLAASSAAAVGDGFVSVKVTDDGDAARRRTNDLNRAAMRAGAQLAECVPASACRPSKVVWDALNRGDLVENPGGLWGVLRGAVSEEACAVLRQIVLERCPLANRQPDVRGDGVAWLPLFRKDDDAWNAAFAPARELLAGVGPALDGFYKRDAPLLVPRNVQVAVYDGTTMNGGYGAHRDNAFRDTVSVTENHRAATAILYLDGRPDSGTGGELRCHVGAAAEDREGATATETVDILPEPGTLVVFDSRTMLHEVRPLAGWKRVALTVWLLRRPQEPVQPRTEDLRTILAALA